MAHRPSPEQEVIIASRASTLLIDAVAGAGKTTTLAMLASRAPRTGSVLECLSFTDSAAKRFRQKLDEEGAPKFLRPRTLADFAQWHLETLVKANVLDEPARLSLATEIRKKLVQAADIVWRRYEERGVDSEFDFNLENNAERLDQIYQVLCRLKSSLRTHRFEEDDFHSFGFHEILEELDLPEPLLEICVAYERSRQVVPGEFAWQTSLDLVPDLVRVLTLDPYAVEKLPKAAVLLVDEWHDVNAAEFELIRLLRRNARLVVVADRDQVIDESRGAELRFSTTEFDAFYKPARLPLKQSRRFGAALSRRATALVSRKVESVEGLHTTIHKLSYDPQDRRGCADAVVQHVRKLYQAEHAVKYSDIAIVVREEDHSIEIENRLLDEGIPYRCEGIASYLLRPEILMLRALLHICSKYYEPLRAGPANVDEMVTALAMFVSMSSVGADWKMDYHQASRRGSKDPLQQAKEDIGKEPAALEWFLTGVLCRPHDSDQTGMKRWKSRLKDFVETVMPNAGTMSAAELLMLADQRLDLAAAVHRAFLQHSQADSAARSIRSFIDFAGRFPRHSLSQFLDELQARQKKVAALNWSQRTGPQIALATIKTAKGQEWNHVIIPYLQAGEFPRGRDLAEESRFLYVAMTRARESLAIAEPSEAFRSLRSPLLHGPRARAMEDDS